jgi:predicted transposase YbfD/YdcC
VSRQVNKGHGRIEERTLTVISDETTGFPHAKQLCQVHRKRTVMRGGEAVKVSEERVCFVTSLSASKATAAQLQTLVRRHWGIENRLHHVRDVTLREDASTIRSHTAPLLWTHVRHAILGLYRAKRASKTECLPAFLRSFAWCAEKALTLVGLVPTPEP